MASTNPLMEFQHDPCTLIATHTRQNWVREPMPKQHSINESVPCRVLLYPLSLSRLCWENPIYNVSTMRRHPRVAFFQGTYLHTLLFLGRGRIGADAGYPRRILNQRAKAPWLSSRRIDVKNILYIVCHELSRRFERLLDDCPLPSPLA